MCVCKQFVYIYSFVSHLCTMGFASCLSRSREGIVCVVRNPYDLEL